MAINTFFFIVFVINWLNILCIYIILIKTYNLCERQKSVRLDLKAVQFHS